MVEDSDLLINLFKLIKEAEWPQLVRHSAELYKDDDEKKNIKYIKKGTIAGGIAGAVLGAKRGHNVAGKSGAIIGGLLGGIGGSLTGNMIGTSVQDISDIKSRYKNKKKDE